MRSELVRVWGCDLVTQSFPCYFPSPFVVGNQAVWNSV